MSLVIVKDEIKETINEPIFLQNTKRQLKHALL